MSVAVPFRTTRWTEVRRAGSASDPRCLEALDALVRQYRPALVEFVRRSQRIPEEEAEECVQGFLAERVVARELLGKADRERGRFRTFLLHAIQSYLTDRHRAQHALKRRPVNGFRSLEEVAEGQLLSQQTTPPGMESLFDEAFARQVVLEAIRKTHAYCMEQGLRDAWVILFARVLGPLLEDMAPTTYGDLVTQLGLPSEAAAYNKLATAKEIFRRQFHALVEDYAATHREQEEEIRYLKRFLRQGEPDSGAASVKP